MWLLTWSWPLSISAAVKPPRSCAVPFHTPAASGSDQRSARESAPRLGRPCQALKEPKEDDFPLKISWTQVQKAGCVSLLVKASWEYNETRTLCCHRSSPHCFLNNSPLTEFWSQLLISAACYRWELSDMLRRWHFNPRLRVFSVKQLMWKHFRFLMSGKKFLS